jgi:hypothetical protein
MEFLLLAAILVFGLVVGLTAVRNAINAELTVLADAILAINFGFTFSGQSGCCSATSGSSFTQIPEQVTPPICVPPAFPVIADVPPC